MTEDRRDHTPRDPRAHPPAVDPAYRSTLLRGPKRAPVTLPQTLSELTGPAFGAHVAGAADADLTRNGRKGGEPIGERIVVAGRVIDEDGRPQPGTLIEIWQANAAGRYVHTADTHDAPLDPNFFGAGRVVTDADGGYRFVTVRPGAYPWGNHANGWRPPHIHLSLFGPTIATRLVTQMYFEGDPLLPHDPIFLSVPDPEARDRLLARLDFGVGQEGRALGYRFDVVLRGRRATPAQG